jgi:tRNA (cmo5U34)-methyltransferase
MEQNGSSYSEWQSAAHALAYLARADKLPHRTEGEKALLDLIPKNIKRILDLGTGNGRLLALLKLNNPDAEGVALDFSDPMLEQAQKRFANDPKIQIIKHDLSTPLPSNLGCFDAVISSLAIHHITHKRKKQLYSEAFNLLNLNGVFCNLEHVSSPTERLHQRFLEAIGQAPKTEDPSNKLLDVQTQLQWLQEIGFTDVDCHWKWLEVALLAGTKPAQT